MTKDKDKEDAKEHNVIDIDELDEFEPPEAHAVDDDDFEDEEEYAY